MFISLKNGTRLNAPTGSWLISDMWVNYGLGETTTWVELTNVENSEILEQMPIISVLKGIESGITKIQN